MKGRKNQNSDNYKTVLDRSIGKKYTSSKSQLTPRAVGEQLKTYTTRIMRPEGGITYSARHFYPENSNQSKSPTIRLENHRRGYNFGQKGPDIVNNMVVDVISGRSSQKRGDEFLRRYTLNSDKNGENDDLKKFESVQTLLVKID